MYAKSKCTITTRTIRIVHNGGDRMHADSLRRRMYEVVERPVGLYVEIHTVLEVSVVEHENRALVERSELLAEPPAPC